MIVNAINKAKETAIPVRRREHHEELPVANGGAGRPASASNAQDEWIDWNVWMMQLKGLFGTAPHPPPACAANAALCCRGARA